MMYTINIYVRFAAMAVCFLGGIALAFAFGFWYAFPFFLIGLVLLIGYVLLGTIQSAAALLQESKFAEAEERLKLTYKPEWLYSANRSVYYMLKSSLAMQRKDMKEGEKYLHLAKEVKLNSDNEKAMVELQLAAVSANKGNWNMAKMHLRNAKALNITEPMIKEQLKEYEKVIAQSGQIKAAQQMQAQMGNRNGYRTRKVK